MSSLRCFVAIELDPEMRAAVSAAGRFIRDSEQPWRDEKWVSADRLHVTVKFLGDVDEAMLPAIDEALSAVSSVSSAFELRATGLAAIPGARHCRMLWARFDDPSGECSALARAIDRALQPLGIDPEDRRFSAHATLCRARRPKHFELGCLRQAESSSHLVGTSMSVGSISLVSSRLGRAEPEYETLSSWHLGG